MTMLEKEIKKCSVCGEKNEVVVVVSTSSFGASDLDTRPAPLRRGIIGYEVERCKKCNYANGDISNKLDFDKKILKSEAYLNVLNSNYPELAKSFMLSSLIMENINKYAKAAFYLLKACWVLDDNNLDAKNIRIKVAKLYERDDINDNINLMLIDIYRRAEEYDEALKWINVAKEKIKDEFLLKIVKYQEVLIDKKDSACHRCDEVDS